MPNNMKLIVDASTGQTTEVPLTQEEIDARIAQRAIFLQQRTQEHNNTKVDIQTIINTINAAANIADVKQILIRLAKQVYRLKYGMTDQQVDDIIAEP